MSARVAGILSYCDQGCVEPAVTELVVTSNGLLLVRSTREVGHNHIVGDEEDLDRNLVALFETGGLTEDMVEFGRLSANESPAGAITPDSRPPERDHHSCVVGIPTATWIAGRIRERISS